MLAVVDFYFRQWWYVGLFSVCRLRLLVGSRVFVVVFSEGGWLGRLLLVSVSSGVVHSSLIFRSVFRH